MKMRYWKFLVTMAIILGLLGMSGMALADSSSGGGSPRYTYTEQIAVGFAISDSGNAHCEGSVVAYDSASLICLTMQLQRYVGGNSWSAVKTWTKRNGSEGSYSLGMTKDYSLTTTGTYRLYVCATVTPPGASPEVTYIYSGERGCIISN